jgi:hypothetical protein
MVLSAILLVPGIATLWTARLKFTVPIVPALIPLSLTGAGALIVNATCVLILARVHHHGGSLTRAAFLSSRNDTLANIAIMLADAPAAALGASRRFGRSLRLPLRRARKARSHAPSSPMTMPVTSMSVLAARC